MSGHAALLPEGTREFWLEAARHGAPPSVVEVARKQYGLMAPWHIRTTLWRDVQGLGSWPGKRRKAYNVSRDHGKSYGTGAALLWAAEYRVPFLPDLRLENRRINLIGRDVDHLRRENMETLENLICFHAPWLKTLDRELWKDPQALKELQIRNRAWTSMQFDLTNGVSIRGYGFNQNVRGGHVVLTWMDDFIDDENAHHGAVHYSKVQSAVLPSVVDGGLLAAVGTPIDDNDVWKYISEEREWNFRSLPAMDADGSLGYKELNEQDIDLGFLPAKSIRRPEDYNCLWPFRMGYDSLMSVRGSSPSSELAFLKEYMMQRAAAWNLLVHPDHFRASKRQDVSYVHNVLEDSEAYTFMGVDPSTLRRSNFVAWVGAKFPVRDPKTGERLYSVIRPLHREKIEVKANEAPEVRKQRILMALDRLRVLFRRYNPRKVVIEGNGFQSAIEPLLEERDARLRGRIESVTLTTNKHMDDGWPMIRTVFEAGHVEMPYGPTPAELQMLERGEITPEMFESRRVTDDFWQELIGIKYHNARILEDDTRPTDQVAGFYFMLRAADYVPDTVELVSGHLDASSDVLRIGSAAPRTVDPEFAPRRAAPAGRTGLGQLDRARGLVRR